MINQPIPSNPDKGQPLNVNHEESHETTRSRSRSNGRKRSYNTPQQNDTNSVNSKNINRYQDDNNAIPQNQKVNAANINQGLQQLQDMNNKVDPSQPRADNQLGFRHARRLYIGNIPETINQEYLSEWLYRSLEAAGGLQPMLPSENPILKCEIDPKGRFAFTEMRSVEETSALLQLDGIILWHRQLRIRRPTEYEKYPQITEGRVPKLNFDLFKTVGIVIIPTVVEDGPNKIFLANLPTKMDELMILDELKLRDMGEIKAFHLVKDNQTNQSKGYAFFEFKDSSLTERAIETLHNMSYAGRTLTCKRSQLSNGGAKNGQQQNQNQNRNNNNGNNNNNNRQNNQQMGMMSNQMQRFQQDPMMDQLNMQMMMNMTDGSNFFPNYPNGMGMPYNMGGGRRNFPNQNQGGFQGMSPQQGNQGGSRRYQSGNGGQQQYQKSGQQQPYKGQQNGMKKQWGGADQQMDGIYDGQMMAQQSFDMNQMYAQYQGQQFMMHDQQNQYQ